MTSLLLSLIMATSALAAESTPVGCSNSANFSDAAYKVWSSAGVQMSAGEQASQSVLIPVNQRAELELHPNGTEFRGYVGFEITTPGTYVIATDAYPRMDLSNLGSGEVLNPTSFGKIRDCGTVSKSLRFEFAQPGKFLLGFVSSQSPVLNILIWHLN